MIIDKKHLKEFSLIPLNYNLDELMNFVPISEMTWIKPLLGDDLYTEIEQQVKDNNVSPENATLLLEAIWPYEGMAVVYEFLPYAYAHISEVGVTRGKSENSDSVDLKDITYLASHIRSQLETFKKNAIVWLQEHAESFPLWNPSDDCGCKPKVTSCCSNGATMNDPEKFKVLYTTLKKNINIQ